MLFFARLVVLVGDFLPEDSKFTEYFCSVFNHSKCRRKVIAWHTDELEKMDPFFHFQLESIKLAFAQDEAEQRGIKSSDPGYPTWLNLHPLKKAVTLQKSEKSSKGISN